MKHILWSAATAALLFASCAKDGAEVLPAPEASGDFTATVAADSRTVLDGTSVKWEMTDEISVFTKTAHNRQYGIKSITDNTATFGYLGYTGSDATAITANYAVYPYNAAATISGDVITTTLPAAQAYDATKVSLANSLMVAKSDDQAFAFKNAAALLRFNVAKEDVPDAYTLKTITLTSTKKIAGEVTIDTGSDNKAVVTENGVTEVVYSLGEGVEVTTTAQSFYVVLAATEFAADELTVKFTFADSQKSVALPAFTLAQNSIKTINYTIKADDFTGTTEDVVDTTVNVSNPEELQEALNDPQVSEIILTGNVDLSEGLTFGVGVTRAATTIAGRDITIDGQGATLTYKGAAGGRIIDVTKEAAGMNLTLKNITLANGCGNYIERGVNYNTTGTLTLENVTIKTETGATITYAINLPASSDKATVVITDSNICGKIALNLWGEETKVTITDSTLSNFDDTDAEGYSTIALNNDGTNAATGSVVTVTGGQIIAKDENGEVAIAVMNSCVAEVKISETTTVVGDQLSPVAIVDYGTNQYYACFTVQRAVDKAGESGATVKLISDVTLPETTVTVAAEATLTLDLNGHTLNAPDTDANHIYAITNNGTLTITDSSAEQSGSINSRGIYNYGSMTLNAGKLCAIDGNGGYAIDNQNGSSFEMNGGWIAVTYEDGDAPGAGYDATGINVRSNATATLNGGKITCVSNFTFAVSVAGGTLTVPETSTITIEGRHGAVSVSAGSVTLAAGAYSVPENTQYTDNVLYVSGGKMTINGGTFTADNDSVNGGACVYDTAGGATINGGVFGNSSGGDVWGTDGTVINGGTFENLVETHRIAEGKSLVDNGDGTATVK